MTDYSSAPVPQRIGDAERDQAVEFLREHLAQGRIDQSEFDERLDIALTARFADDLSPLFADLPAPRPGSPAVPTGIVPAESKPMSPVATSPSGPNRTAMVLGTMAAFAWPIAIVAMIAFSSVSVIGHFFWLFWLLPIFMTGSYGRYRGGHRGGPGGGPRGGPHGGPPR